MIDYCVQPAPLPDDQIPQCYDVNPVADEPQTISFDNFMGINLRRADPIARAVCVGSVREYHAQQLPALQAQHRQTTQDFAVKAEELQTWYADKQISRTLAANQLLAENAKIKASYPYEINRKLVNHIFLNTIAKGIADYSADELFNLINVAE